jgi:hypothetical protein
VIRFLLRIAFWLSIVVLLLPSDPAKRGDNGRTQVGPTEAFEVAHAALDDARDFCARRPDTCVVGSQAFQTFGQKAQHGAKLLYEFLSNRFAETPPSPRGEARVGGANERPGRHTLTPEDMAPGWNGPGRKSMPLPPRRPA